MWIDTHCHLDAREFDADRDAVIEQARAAGVRHIVVPAIARWNFDVVRALAHRQAGCCYALGIHPLCAAQASDDDLIELRRQVAASMDDPRFVAVGEIGLDFFIPDPQVERQNAVYQAQLKIAREFDLPVLLHVRKSQDQVRSAAARAGVRRGIAHAFNGSDDQARHYIETGFKLGFGGVLTFSRAHRIRRLAAEMPLESIVLETDAPDLAPAWLADDQFSEQVGTRNAPAEVAGIAAALAELRGISLDTLAAQARRNSVEAIPRLAALLES
ncbi:TatD family hydrolase [Ralstonia pseudosolanacearum]|uniref:TatD family hydrolase n=1 Tax=Ralstonia pseudosolanacearum TaxID=1310165 RepID=UPI001866ADEA|nr:TatD family hydrolase [Ralstonia pseudosolanacearum]QOK92177.1 TatD family hydrolase [Ralstonia pseudosolanacearum]UWD92331.1 TatD family hydrolase [Ralstonia pseudosolanacearum]CAH0439342.1 putative metal-dependent hydrolase YjjV [Ralstonia pseudosolanacearum]